MNIQRYPELLERLAASYALGTLRGGARRRFETLAREHPSVRAAALLWQSHWAGLTELQTPQAPPPAVWTRIDNLIRAEQERAAMRAQRDGRSAETASPPGPVRWWHSVLLWRGAAAAGALATVVAVAVGVRVHGDWQATASQQISQITQLQQQLLAAPQIQYVAVLADEQAAASMLVTFDPHSQKLVLQRVGGFAEPDDRSLQLWALPPTGGPRSLGVLGQEKLLRLTAADADLRAVPTLAISLEPKGGVPSATGPTGPVLFKGAVIERML